MRSKTFLGIFCCCLLLSSCEFILKEPAEGKINYLIIGESYYAYFYTEGLNEYSNRLNYTVADAKSMKETIAKISSKTGRAIGEGHYVMLEEEGTQYSDFASEQSSAYPTLENVNKGLSALANISDDDSLTIIYYSGHGTDGLPNIKTGSLCFVKQTYAREKTVGNFSKLIDFGFLAPQELLEKVNAIPGKKLIILDSCYSGAIADDYGVTHNTDTNIGDIWDAYFSDSQYGLTDLYMLTAASSQTTSTEYANLEHGVFTYYLLKGLGWTADGEELSTPAALDSNGYVTLDSLYKFILPKASQSQYQDLNHLTRQHATTNGTADNLVLFKY